MSLNQSFSGNTGGHAHASAVSPDRVKSLPIELNERLLKRLNKSIVFADAQFMEWFTLTVGVDAVVSHGGAHNIKEFSALENGEEHPKAVFLIAQPLRAIVLDTLKEIVIASRFQYVIIVTSVEPSAYDESRELFDRLSDECLIWMSNPVDRLNPSFLNQKTHIILFFLN